MLLFGEINGLKTQGGTSLVKNYTCESANIDWCPVSQIISPISITYEVNNQYSFIFIKMNQTYTFYSIIIVN